MNDVTQKTYPAHYTPTDIKTVEKVQGWLIQKTYTQAALARLARTSPSTLNQVLGGSYLASPAKILGAIESAMHNVDESAANKIAVVETSVFKLAQATCAQARLYRNFAVMSAYVGTGKTFSMRHYAATHPNTYLIEATPMMTVNTLIKLLARKVLGYEVKGGLDDKFTAIVSAVSGTDTLFIFDEAETVTPGVLNTLRRLRDIANVGIVLCGTEHLRGILKPEHGQFDQIRSRCGFFPETIQGITQDDTAALAQAGFGAEDVPDDVVKRLHQYSRGSARMLVEGLIAGLREFRGGRELSIKLVDAVAKQALCLQSIA
jgi:hypothetical protein